MEGQISIFDLFQKPEPVKVPEHSGPSESVDKSFEERYAELDAKYEIPRKYQKEEGWTDDWHYTELETPKEHGIYYCIHYGYNADFYMYTYMAWAYGHWWAYAGYGTKWLIIREGTRRDEWMRPFAWVTVPDLYYRKDEHHRFLCENFVTREDWEYEERIEALRKDRRAWITNSQS